MVMSTQWEIESTAPVFMLCDLLGNPIVELPMASWTVNGSLSSPADADLSVDTHLRPELAAFLEPWQQTIVMIADGKPVWGGTITKRRTTLGRTVSEIGCREWSGWLDRVWTTEETEYIAGPTPDDAGDVIFDRMSKAASIAEYYVLVPPLVSLTHDSPPTGVSFDADFEDQSFETAPQTFLANIGTINSSSGVDWTMRWRESGGRYLPELRTFLFTTPAEPRQVLIGTEAVTATLELDTTDQANGLKIVGESDDYFAGGSTNSVPLWRAFSFEKITSQSKLEKVGDRLASMIVEPILTVTQIETPGSRHEFEPGDRMVVVVPADFDERYPQGVEAEMRVTGVTWRGDANGANTSYTLAALYEGVQNVPDALTRSNRPPSAGVAGPTILRHGLVSQLRDMQDRIHQIELRRPERLPPVS